MAVRLFSVDVLGQIVRMNHYGRNSELELEYVVATGLAVYVKVTKGVVLLLSCRY